MSAHGWSLARHRCGRCGHSFTTTDHDDFVTRYSIHAAAHELLDTLSADARAELSTLLPDMARIIAADAD